MRHPNEYPSADAHWSPMVVVGHSPMFSMWANGTKASPGVEMVAEVRSFIRNKNEKQPYDRFLNTSLFFLV